MSIQERELPKTLNSLMKHLRDGGIAIDGSAQKRRLKNIGYYHGYKGYRFAGNASNRLPPISLRSRLSTTSIHSSRRCFILASCP